LIAIVQFCMWRCTSYTSWSWNEALYFAQDSAVNMEELEEALVIVKQRRDGNNPELDFLHKVDEEQNKGLSVNLMW